MSLHKLSAGDGYTYLTRQVAAADDTNRGRGTLASYYEQKGESPGVWLGSGLDSLDGSVPECLVVGIVTEAQMTGPVRRRAPPERRCDRAPTAARWGPRPCAGPGDEAGPRVRDFNTARGERATAAIPASDRARIRTELAREWFRTAHGRDALDAREFTSYLARVSRPAPMPVAVMT